MGDLVEGDKMRLLREATLQRAIMSNTPTNEVDYVFQTTVSNFAMGFWIFNDMYPFPGSASFGFGGQS